MSRADDRIPPIDETVAARMRRAVHPPAPPADRFGVDLQHPAHHLGRECSAEELEAYARAAAPPGWSLEGQVRSIWRDRFRGLRAEYRRLGEETTPWSVAVLREEHELCGGDWQAVAAVLSVPYRELRRWLDHESLRELAPLWEAERQRVQEREREGRRPELGMLRDPDAIHEALEGRGPMRAVIRLLEVYVDCVERGRPVYDGIREYLRRAGWIDNP